MKYLWLIAALALAGGCERNNGSAPEPAASASSQIASSLASHTSSERLSDASRGAWQGAGQLWQEAAVQARQLEAAIESLLNSPSPETLAQARQQWRRAHRALWQAQLPAQLALDKPDLFADLSALWQRLHASPITPGYIDTIEGYPHSGIVNDTTVALNARSLRQQHQLTHDEEIILGLHALEFLLWGEAGERPATDFAAAAPPQGSELRATDMPSRRRRDLIALVATLYADDLQQLAEQWQNPADTLARPYWQLPPASRLALWHELTLAHLDRLKALYFAQDHCAYAGQCRALTPALEGLETVLTTGIDDGPGAIATLIPARAQGPWRETLARLQAADPDASLEEATVTQDLDTLKSLLTSDAPGPEDAASGP